MTRTEALWCTRRLEDTAIAIIDGDRGKNYPNKNELRSTGYCAFLNNRNLIGDKISLDEISYISEEKDAALRNGKIQVGDIVITTRGSVGNVGLFHNKLKEKFARINSGMVILRNNDSSFDTNFLYQLLKSPFVKSQFFSLTTGSAQPQLPIKDLKKIELLSPPIEIQHRIADILGAIDAKMELNLRMNETLEQMAMVLYEYLFINTQSTERIPVYTLIEINPKNFAKKGQEIPYVEMKALPTNSLSVLDTDVIVREFTSGSKFRNDDTLFARITPCLENGKTAFVNFLAEDGVGFGSTEFLVFRAKSGVSPAFVYCTARWSGFRDYAMKSMVGTSGRQRVQAETIAQFELPPPKEETMTEFDSMCRPWFTQIRNNTLENLYLASLRDYLLPRLLSGEVCLSRDARK